MKRLLAVRFTGPLVGFALAVAIAGSALAYFSAEGTGTASAAVSKLTTPTITAATPAAGGTVTLAWSAATAPGVDAVRYYVTRDGGEPAGTCPPTATPAAVLTCKDSGVEIGTHTYTVTAVWRSWTATSSSSAANVTVGEATHFTISAAATTIAVGATDNLTITAKDAKENTVSTYTGSHSLVFSGAAASPSGTVANVINSSGATISFGSATAINFTAGVATVASARNGVLKVYRAGVSNIAATEGTINTPLPLALTVTPGSATKYALAGATSTPTAGSGDALTITAQDTYGNTAISYTGSHSLVFSGPAASPSGALPTVSDSAGNVIAFGTATPIVFSAGVASSSAGLNGEMTLYKSGANAVTATEGTIKNTTAVTFTVAAAAATKLILAATTTTPVAAAANSLTITARDVYENTATSYAGAKSLTFSGALASPSGAAPTVVNSAGTAVSFGAATALTFTAGVAAVASSKNGVMKLNKAGATNVSATDGTISTAAPLALTVATGPASRLGLTSVTASAGSIAANCLLTCTITGLGNLGTVNAKVSVVDSVGNTVSEVGTGHTVKITATTGGTVIGTPLTIEATGPAVSSTSFTYTAPAAGSFTHTITAATLAGTVYTSATATATK